MPFIRSGEGKLTPTGNLLDKLTLFQLHFHYLTSIFMSKLA